MELCLACLPLVTLLTLLTAEVTPSLAQKVYTNTWAVHISGGEEEANRVAQKYGFINHGNVSIERAMNSVRHFGVAVISGDHFVLMLIAAVCWCLVFKL